MRVLVTGGSGYIGSQTVRRLAADGNAVVTVDLVPPSAVITPAIESFVEADIRAAGVLDDIFGRSPIDAVIHLAAYKSVEESMREPGRYFDGNVLGTLRLLDAMVRASVRSMVFSSTCAVYGNPEHLPATEETPLCPENPYGASKLMAEEVLRWYGRCHGIRSISLRYFNAAGAALEGDLGEAASTAANLVPRVMKAVLGRAPRLTVFGTDYPTVDGSAIRDYVHVVDLADAHVLAVRRLRDGASTARQMPGGTLPEVLNLGTGRGSSVLEVIAMVREVSGRHVPLDYGQRRPGDTIALWADSAKARKELGWEPRYGLREIVETAWRWHAGHPDL